MAAARFPLRQQPAPTTHPLEDPMTDTAAEEAESASASPDLRQRYADAVMAVRDTELEQARAERDRYRLARDSARRRAECLLGTLDGTQSNLERAEAALDRVREGEPMAPEDYDREQFRAAVEQCAAGLRAFAEALAPAIRTAAQAIAQAAGAARDDYALAPPPAADTTDA